MKTKSYVSWLSVTWRVLVIYAGRSSHIRQGGHRIASPLTSRLSVRIMGELGELLQPSILVLVSTIYAVLSKSLGAVVKFMLELVALLRRIICVCVATKISPDKLSVLRNARSPLSAALFYSVSSKNFAVVVKVDHLSVKHFQR